MSFGVLFTLSGVAVDVHAQQATSGPEYTAAGGKVTTGNAPDAVAAGLAGELTTSKIIADPGAPYENLFQNFGVGLGVTPKFGAAETYFRARPLGLGTSAESPIRRGFQPESAELKIGDFYLDLNYLTASAIYSDNVNLTETNREGQFLSAVTLGVSALYQLTEGLQIGVSGAFIWLPSEGEFGIAGFGLVDPFARFAIDGQPLFEAGISYDMTLGGWDVRLFDEFVAHNRSAYGFGQDGFLDLYDGESFDEGEDEIRKQRIYKTPSNNTQAYNRADTTTTRFDADNTDLQNTAGVVASRLLPTATRASLGFYHHNFWDLADNSQPGAANVNSLDVFDARLDSERENLRFKPYVQYTAMKNNIQKGWDQILTGGVRGPITENMFFDGSAGYVFSGNSDKTSLIWMLRLVHEINPSTLHVLQYFRTLTQPERFLTENVSYQITKILGPYIRGSLYARRQESQDLDNSNTLFILEQVGLTFNYDLAEHGEAYFQGFFSRFDYRSGAVNDYDLLTLRFIYARPISATVNGEFFYQFEKRDSEAANDSYYENIVGVRLTKTF